MLTYPSDSLPHIVCPMDEDALLPHPFSSAPPHSQPPPPLLPLPSTTPSCASDGIPGHRRSGRIQGIRSQTPKKQNSSVSQAALKPSKQDPSPAKRRQEDGSLVQQSKQPRVDRTPIDEEQIKDGTDTGFAVEHPLEDSKNARPQIGVDASLGETTVGTNCCSTDPREDMYSDPIEVDDESLSAPKGWVIGPLFQSFKSKMASFTEIVMSPVKLFKSNSSLPSVDGQDVSDVSDDGNERTENKLPDSSSASPPGSESINLSADIYSRAVGSANGEDKSKTAHLRKLDFDQELSTHIFAKSTGNQEGKQSPILVPLLTRPLPVSENETAIVLQSASQEPSVCQQRIKLLPRKCTGNGCEAGKVRGVTPTPQDGEVAQKSEVADEQLSQLSENKPKAAFSFTPDCLESEMTENYCFVQVGGDEESQQKMEPKFDPEQKDSDSRSSKAFGETRRELARQLLDPLKKESPTSDTNALILQPKGLKSPKRKVRVTKAVTGCQELLNPASIKQTAPIKESRKGKRTQAVLVSVNDEVSHMHTECKMKPIIERKRLKTRASAAQTCFDLSMMDLETTMAISSSKPALEAPLQGLLSRPEIRKPQNVNKGKNVTKRPSKRKLPNRTSLGTESNCTLNSREPCTESVLIPSSEHGPSCQQGENTREQNLPSKRPKKGFRCRASVSNGKQEATCCSDNSHSAFNDETVKIDPLYFEMTPFEQNSQPSPPVPSQCLNNNALTGIEEDAGAGTGQSSTLMVEDVIPDVTSSVSVHLSKLRPSTARVKPRRTDPQRRKCRVLTGRTHKAEDTLKAVTMEDTDMATSRSDRGFPGRLLRSYSCPEIHSLRPHDAPWTSPLYSPQHTRPSHHHSHATSISHKSQRRARRHTVCSMEVEREIAPLCLRKEVYPTRRSIPSDAANNHLSLSVLASCFLSSPLAFLSKKTETRGADSSPASSNRVCTPTSPLTSPSSKWLHTGFHPRTSSSGAALDHSSSGTSLQRDLERRPQSEDEEDTSSSSQEFEDVGLREEKALSDSEIKVVEKGKVSSIRIRKALPKPQNNLTPMGLPKPIRLKKKQFSLEEIYTNKNFSKPAERRLETIFEVPLNRRNGSESWFGQRRVRRFLEFLEVGEARKPKKPLAGVGKGSLSSSRTRRGGFPKDEPPLSVQDVDSLLCAKLDQLSLWLLHDQMEG